MPVIEATAGRDNNDDTGLLKQGLVERTETVVGPGELQLLEKGQHVS